MKAAVLHAPNTPLEIEDVGLNKPGPREVLIRTAVAGLCHGDLHFMEGLYPHPLPALIGCGVITGVGAVIHSARVEPGSTVAVIGCGGVGMAAVNGAALAGAGRIIAVDTVPAKLEMAKKIGATDAVNPKDGDPVKQ